MSKSMMSKLFSCGVKVVTEIRLINKNSHCQNSDDAITDRYVTDRELEYLNQKIVSTCSLFDNIDFS